MSIQNPYQPPTNCDVVETDSRVCPDCGSPMIAGHAAGSLHWTNKDVSFFRRFISRGKSLMGRSFIITLRTPRLAGFHCEMCGLTMLRKNR
ncbi:MAG: hypothetical protein WCS43_06125 [Verrucomicrobiota bacterium]